MSDEGMNRFLNYLRTHPPKSESQKRRVIAAFLDKYALYDKIEEVVDLPGMTDDMPKSCPRYMITMWRLSKTCQA